MTRPTIDEYYLGIAQAVSARAECVRRKIGAVIVKDDAIIGTGFNGAPPGERSCLDGACPRARKDVVAGIGYAETGCVAIHAEVNAIIRAGRERCLGATLYVTDTCCVLCAPIVRAAGIIRVVTPHNVGLPIKTDARIPQGVVVCENPNPHLPHDGCPAKHFHVLG